MVLKKQYVFKILLIIFAIIYSPLVVSPLIDYNITPLIGVKYSELIFASVPFFFIYSVLINKKIPIYVFAYSILFLVYFALGAAIHPPRDVFFVAFPFFAFVLTFFASGVIFGKLPI